MARLLSIGSVAEQALRKIGAYTTADSGADGNDLAIAMEALDVVMAHKLATNRMWFLVPDVVSVSLSAETQDYDLASLLGSSWPDEGYVFVIDAYLTDTGGARYPVEIIRRDEWDALDHTETGTPSRLYFDRSAEDTITMRTWPVLGASASGWSAKLTAQQFAPHLTGGSVIAAHASGLPATWNMWAIYELAAFIGDGTIRRLSDGDIKGFRDQAMILMGELERMALPDTETNPIAEPWSA